MLKKKSLLVVLSCVAVLGLIGCGDDDVVGVCGDGIAEGNEECDGQDLASRTCADVVTGSTGQLTCSGTCTYDTSQCILCGDGVRSFGEDCDCGTNPALLPTGCQAINGGTGSNCSADCVKIEICGDGVVDTNEDCDCGTDPLNLPSGCNDVNGSANGTCTDLCIEELSCGEDPQHPTWDGTLYSECDPLLSDFCCEDDYGVQLDCKSSLFQSMDNMCARTCTAIDDCPWNNMCWGSFNPAFDLCHYSMCGPGDIVEAEFFASCLAGGNSGLCIPFGRYSDTKDPYGFCLEYGDIAHGSPCPTSNADPPIYLLGTDRDITGGAAASMCDTGLCLATQGALEGICAQFCDWEAEYEAIFYGGTASPLACPTDSNCWAEATISQDDVSPYADFGYRAADLGYCMPTESSNPTMGMTTCSLITGQLLSNTSQTCADTHTDGQCKYVTYSADYYDANGNVIGTGSEPTLGSLVGVCDPSTPVTVSTVWGACTVGTDVCPLGSVCVEEDIFDDANGQARCIPYCDTEHHDGTTASCSDLGAVPTGGATPVCTSLSNLFPPGGLTDTRPTRLGYCALPMP